MSNREQVINDLQTQIEELEERLTIALEGQPEIIRCKDCKHYKRDTCSVGAGMAFPPPDDWFCADGERRTDDA